MNIMNKCILELIDSGELSDPTVAKLKQDFKDGKMKNQDDYFNNNYKKKKQAHSKNVKSQKLTQQIAAEAKLSEDPFEYFAELITKGMGKASKKMNIEYKIKQVHATALQPLAKHFDDLRSKFGGVIINKPLLDNISQAIFKSNYKPDEQVQGIVKAMNESLEIVNKLVSDDNPLKITSLKELASLSNKVQNYTPQEFVDFVKPLVNDSDEVIKQLHKNALEGDELGKLSFKSGDALAEYQQKIGGDTFSNLINYIDKSSASIASEGVFGKFPKNNLKRLMNDANIGDEEQAQLLNMYGHATGTLKQTKNISSTTSLLSGARALGTASMMGSSPLTAIMDFATIIQTARFNGIPVLPIIGRVIKNAASKKSRMELSQLGFQLESVLSSLSQTSRFNPHSSTNDTLNKIATGVLRTSGLLALSDTMKLAVKNTFLVTFKDLQKSTFEGLLKKNPNMHKQLLDYGINKSDWDIMRKFIGDDFRLNPLELAKHNDEVGSKFFRLINEEADYAVVTPGARSAYWTSLGKQKGSLEGEAIKSVTQFKSTIVEQIVTHFYRAAKQTGIQNQLGYGGIFLINTTILGGLVYQVKEFAMFRTPMDPTTDPKKFLAESLKQGGGLPYFTDVLLPQMIDPQFGGGQVKDLLAPAALSTPIRIAGNLPKTVIGDKTDEAQSAIIQDIMRMIPGANIWYVKALVNQIKSYVGYLIAPEKERKKQRRLEKEMKKHNQKHIF